MGAHGMGGSHPMESAAVKRDDATAMTRFTNRLVPPLTLPIITPMPHACYKIRFLWVRAERSWVPLVTPL